MPLIDELWNVSRLTWQVMQLTPSHNWHLNVFVSSWTKHHPAQSGVLQWNVLCDDPSACFRDFFSCFAKTSGDTSCNQRRERRHQLSIGFARLT